MTSRRGLGRILRRAVVALANRTTRRAKRSIYARRVASVEGSAREAAIATARSFGGMLYDDSFCGLGLFDDSVVDAAEKAVSGSFVLFEEWFPVPKSHSGTEEAWNRDYTTGYTFPMRPYVEVRVQNNVADIKVPWEYGRMQRLLPLAAAYRRTNDVRYLDAFRGLVMGFREASPLAVGVQWACTMEVGIRIFNVLAAYELLREQIASLDELHVVVAELALCHAEHIWANLETSARLQENNHYIADLLGLAAVAACYPLTRKASAWGTYAKKELVRCARKQVLADGCCFERSTRYTRLVGEMLFYAGKALSATDFALPGCFWERLAVLGTFLESVTDERGNSPQVGDNDSGRVLVLNIEGYNDLRLVGRLVARERGILCRDAPVLFAEEALLYGASMRVEKLDSWSDGLRTFPAAGMAFARRGRWSLGFFAIDGFRDEAEPGHTHNDKLSVTLGIDGLAFLVDPGSGTYTRDVSLRNVLRGTAQHSTLWFEGTEQNEFLGLFGYRRCGGASLNVEGEEPRVLLRGETDCWQTRTGCSHVRTVSLDDDAVRVADALVGSGAGGRATRSFVLSPSVSVVKLSGTRAVLANEGVRITLESNAPLTQRGGLYSKHYGVVEQTLIIDTPYVDGEVNEVMIARVTDAC